MTTGSAAVKPGEDFEEPLAMLSGTVIYVAMANVCYTLGWVVDTVLYTGTREGDCTDRDWFLQRFSPRYPEFGLWLHGSSPCIPDENSIEMDWRKSPFTL